MGQSAVPEFRFTRKTFCLARLIYMDNNILAFIRKQYYTWDLSKSQNISVFVVVSNGPFGLLSDSSQSRGPYIFGHIGLHSITVRTNRFVLK